MQSALLNATKKLNRDQGHEAGESCRWREVRSRLSYKSLNLGRDDAEQLIVKYEGNRQKIEAEVSKRKKRPKTYASPLSRLPCSCASLWRRFETAIVVIQKVDCIG